LLIAHKISLGIAFAQLSDNDFTLSFTKISVCSMLIRHRFFSHALSHFDDMKATHSLFTPATVLESIPYFSSRSVGLFCLAMAVVMLPACQSAIRFSSTAKVNVPPPVAASPSLSPKSHANSSKTTSKPSIPLSIAQERIMLAAERWIGTPYRYGSTTRTGTDCSGFVMRVYEETGMNIPRSTKDQFVSGVVVEREELTVGDLLFFNTNGAGVSHVGIYAGQDTVIHASSTHGVVKQSFSDTYLAKTFIGARRVIESKATQ
jgi:cell wall-associated NlpC family hydrolase